VPTHRYSRQRAARITEHIWKLETIFPGATVRGGALWDRLHRLEAEAHSAAERYSSYPTPEGYIEKKTASILRRLDELLRFREAGVPVFVNWDPRGYVLKIEEGYARKLNIERDWGGYGILVPRL